MPNTQLKGGKMKDESERENLSKNVHAKLWLNYAK